MATPPFDWSTYLALARELATRNDEAALRSSVSRAYYYIYHLGLTRAQNNGFIISRGESSHKQVWRLFTDNPETLCAQLGQLALRLKEKRERADYEPNYARIQDDLPIVLEDAERFQAGLTRLAPRHPNPASARQGRP
jgi:hypothetical protein